MRGFPINAKPEARVAVTGGNGFVGRHVMAELARRGYDDAKALGRAECDLADANAVRALLDRVRPTHVIHLAAAVGGIGANLATPGFFAYANTIMGANVLEACRVCGIGKLVNIGTICVYPHAAPVPTPEVAMFEGFPASDTAPYGIAKRNLWMMGSAYRKQYGMDIIYVIPTNIYGPEDHFDTDRSHVVSALIRRFIEARNEGAQEVQIWGDGSVTREFIYAEDVAIGIVDAMERYSAPEPLNLGTGEETSIRELAEIIRDLTRFKGVLTWDPTKPAGALRRSLDVSKARSEIGFNARTSLEAGLSATIEWYEERFSKKEL